VTKSPAIPFHVWLQQHGYSKQEFADMERRGIAPRVIRPPGKRKGFITEADDKAWEEKMIAYTESEAGRREAERRVEIARAAGRASAKSRKHYQSAENRAARRAARTSAVTN
jgi:hypothetical protein